MEASPLFQPAIVQATGPPGTLEICSNGPFPTLLPHQVLIKVAAVALNPCDWKMPTRVPCPGAVDGTDFSGTVMQVGDSVTCGLKVGDRVAGAQHASNPTDPACGAFKQYITAAADQLWKIPETISWEEAAAIGLAVVSSVGMALFVSLKLQGTPEKPLQEPCFVLVYGGATASGTIAIQLLKLSGYRVITTCSPSNFEMVESYGAEKAFDYKSPTCGEDIRSYSKNTLQYALDIITEVKTIQHCYAAIGRAGGKYTGFELLPDDYIASLRKAVKAEWVLGLEMSGAEIALPGGYYRKPNPELRAWFCDWVKRVEILVRAGKLRPHPVKVNEGGLEAIIAGVGAMQRKEVSAQKMVYLIGPRDSYSMALPIKPKLGAETNGVMKTKISIPTMQKGLKVLGQNRIGLESNLPIPRPREDEILVRVLYASLNPVDAKSADLSPAIGATSGCDLSGEVVILGKSVKNNLFVGDKVCGCVFGNNPDNRDNGAFAEYVVIPGDLVLKIPAGISLKSASTLPMGLGTVGMALYQELKLEMPIYPAPKPSGRPSFVLVYGGSTATGRLAIQMLRMSGMTPIATCSLRNFRMVQNLGAQMVFDYQSPRCGSDIRSFTENSLEYVMDCIGDKRSMEVCYSAIREAGGRCVALEPYSSRALAYHNIQTTWIIAFTMFGQAVSWKPPYQRDPQRKDREFVQNWFQHVQKLLDQNALILPSIEEKTGGLESVVGGIDMIRRGTSGSKKLVYKIQD